MAQARDDAGGRRLRILMLHGFTQSGELFEIKTKALKKALQKAFPPAPRPGHLHAYPGGVELRYPTGPIKLDVQDIPGVVVDDRGEQIEAYAWWRRKDDGGGLLYNGMDTGFATIARCIEEDGPFDGVLGFSQGGAAAGMVASLLEDGRKDAFDSAQARGGIQYPRSFDAVQLPMKFAVSYSGFAAAPSSRYQAFYEPRIQTPMLHILGSVDTVVSEERSLRLVEACLDDRVEGQGVPRLVYHPGGHFLPSSQKHGLSALVAFIREAVGESQVNTVARQLPEEKAEDMDMPF